MKIGSLVECINDNWKRNDDDMHISFPIKGNLYTVRDIIDWGKGGIGIRLEEIINSPDIYVEGVSECTFNIRLFKELQPPIDISELIEELNVNVCTK